MLFETRQRYKNLQGVAKLDIATGYNAIVDKKAKLLKKMLVEDLSFSQEDIVAIEAAATQIKTAAENQQVIDLLINILVKYIDFP